MKGGRPVTHTKWEQEDSDSAWTSTASDCNGGTLYKSITCNEDGSFDAVIVHHGLLKFSSELQELTRVTKKCKSLAIAKDWCRKQANSLAFKHDILVELKPKDYRTLSLRTVTGPLAPGSPEDFGASQRAPEQFRTKRRRK